MSAASRPMIGVNPHLAGALSLILLGASIAGGVFLFGDPEATRPVVRAAVPDADAAAETATQALRGDAIDLSDGADLDRLAEAPTGGEEPSLDGVRPIDETAPVRTRAELAAAEQNRNALPTAPLPGLTEPGPGGLLPVISPDGMRPADAYQRPFVSDGRPMVALIVGGLGMSESRTRQAIEELPPEITLAFVPYADNLQDWIDLAREYGHEALIELPMEPFDYPENDPGPHTLLSDADRAENIRRLDWLLSRATGYFGVTNYLGAKLATSEDAQRPIFEALERRGLELVHDGASPRSPLGRAAQQAGLGWTSADRVIDASPAPDAIDEELLELEALALQNGAALGMGFAYPVTLEQAKAWAEGLAGKGYALAPASAALEARTPS